MGGKGPGLLALETVMDRVVCVLGKRLRKRRKKAGMAPVREVTLDIDATQIVAEKSAAQWTYKGEKGYMPLVGHVKELSGMVVHEEFREGNASPGAGHVPFIEDCLRRLLKGIRLARFRADSASYQASVINLCQEKGMRYVIGADLDCAVRTVIEAIPGSSFRPYRGGHIAETVHTMNKTDSAFRLIVVKVPIQTSLPEMESEEASEKTRYKVQSTNHKENPEWIVDWYNQRGDKGQRHLLPYRCSGHQPLSSVSGTDPLRRLWPVPDPDGAMAGLSGGRRSSAFLSKDQRQKSSPDGSARMHANRGVPPVWGVQEMRCDDTKRGDLRVSIALIPVKSPESHRMNSFFYGYQEGKKKIPV